MKTKFVVLWILLSTSTLLGQTGIGLSLTTPLIDVNIYEQTLRPGVSIFHNFKGGWQTEIEYSRRKLSYSEYYIDKLSNFWELFFPNLEAERPFVTNEYSERMDQFTLRLEKNIFVMKRFDVFMGLGIGITNSLIEHTKKTKSEGSWSHRPGASNIEVYSPNNKSNYINTITEIHGGVSYQLSPRLMIDLSIIGEILSERNILDNSEFGIENRMVEFPETNINAQLALKFAFLNNKKI